VRLELKHFQRHVMTNTLLHPDDVDGWRGEIRDGKVVSQPGDEDEQDEGPDDEQYEDRDEDQDQDEYDDEDEYEEDDEDDEEARS
jgi:hypothetical protein